jgi:hypothetical protein
MYAAESTQSRLKTAHLDKTIAKTDSLIQAFEKTYLEQALDHRNTVNLQSLYIRRLFYYLGVKCGVESPEAANI